MGLAMGECADDKGTNKIFKARQYNQDHQYETGAA
jgi:hypothetical protein